jgi:hypothetical protein
MTDWKSSLRADPIPWLLENACAPIRYRVLTELLDRSKDDPDVLAARQAVLEYPPAVTLQRKQRKDGTWGGQIHAGDAKKLEPSVENALTLLYEMAWGRDTKPVRQAAATLRGFLTSKKDLKFYEFAKVVKADEKRERYYRWYLRTIALGLLVRGGYVDDRSRTAVLELLDLTAGFVDDPVSRHPVEEIGPRTTAHPGGRVEARLPLPPGPRAHARVRVLTVAFGRRAREDAAEEDLGLRHVRDVSEARPRARPRAHREGLVRQGRGAAHPRNRLLQQAREPRRAPGQSRDLRAARAAQPLSQMMAHLEWWQGQQTKEGRWNLQGKLLNESSRWTALLRLEKDWRSPTRKEADLTFRVLVLLKYQWERQIRMLDRRDDGYTI